MTVVARFEGCSALVTGGAAGIGKAVVRQLAREGAHVTFCDTNETLGSALARELVSEGLSARFARSDATDESAVERLVALAMDRTGRLDVAVNNVGGFGAGDSGEHRIHDTPLSAWHATVTLNLTSCFLGMKHELKPMLAQRDGAIVNLASMAALRWADVSCPSYSAAKAAVVRLTEYAAIAYAAYGVRVNVVAPGLTATEGVLAAFPNEADRNAIAGAHHPMGRMIEPGEIADAVLWAASSAASSVTGLTIPVSGGWAAG
jgi:NAD(P)-dependent dehydrogenase (short-subunit alcohol dehydrogenase family)